jgi:2-(1,2-epoxy-1,2-dihydrophenyl)acetyl-CoA isomerase
MAQATGSTAELPLLTKSEGGVLTLTMNRPRALNALSHGLLAELLAALKKAEKDPAIRVVVIAGAGRAYSSGADLVDLKKMYDAPTPPSLGDELRFHFNPVINQIRMMEKPVIAAIHGTAAGAGASLALACDMKVCAESAKFIFAFAQVGLAPDSGMSFFTARAMGLGIAMEYALTGKPLVSMEAARFGLVNQVVPDAELEAKVNALAAALAKVPPQAAALTKRAFNRALGNDFSAQLEYEIHIQEILGKTKDHREGVMAFMEGRKPVFTGE